MTKKDVLEIKKVFKSPEDNSVDKMAGCYVNGNKEKLTVFTGSLLNTDEDEIHKYLEIAKKTLSGKIGDVLLYAPFTENGRQEELSSLVKSGLNDRDVLNAFFDRVIEDYEYAGNFLILLFHDCYDVITKGTDEISQDESEYVHEFILCSICPVDLSKPGLGYLSEENRIGARLRDWMVSVPINGFMYPAFTERYTDTDHLLYFCKNGKEPHMEFLVNTLGCEEVTPASVYRNILKSAVFDAVEDEGVNLDYIYMDVQQALQDKMEDDSCKTISAKDVKEIALDAGLTKEQAKLVADSYEEETDGKEILSEILIDEKILKKAEEQAEIRTLKETVKDLSEKLQNASCVKKEVDVIALKEQIISASDEDNEKSVYVIDKEVLTDIFRKLI